MNRNYIVMPPIYLSANEFPKYSPIINHYTKIEVYRRGVLARFINS